jgi:hypothetical protein
VTTTEQESLADDAAPHRSMPLPLDRAVLWYPERAGTADPLGGRYPLFVTQRLLADVVSAATAPQGAFGFLIGEPCFDPARRLRFVVASHHLRLQQPFRGDQTAAPVQAGWSAVRAEIGRTGGVVVGWYHSHEQGGVQPSGGDVATHRRHFDDPWQVMLIVSAAGGVGRGLWYRPGLMDRRPLPFYELLDAPPAAGGARVSRMTWSGYVPADPAVVVEPAAVTAGAQPSQLFAHFIHPAAFTPVADDDEDAVPGAPLPPPEPRVTGAMVWTAAKQLPGWGRLGLGAGAVLLLAIVGYGLYAFVMGGPSRPVVVVAPPPAATAAPTSPERAELETAMRGFADADRMFASGQATCDVLARSLVRVEEAWLAYNTARRGAAGSSSNLAAAVAGDDQPLVDAVDTVETRFERSRCPRP